MVKVTSLLAKAESALRFNSVLESELEQKWRYIYGALKACIG